MGRLASTLTLFQMARPPTGWLHYQPGFRKSGRLIRQLAYWAHKKPHISGYCLVFYKLALYTRYMLDIATLGQIIARHRTDLRLTQAELARRARIGRSTLDAIENGRMAELGFGKVSRLLAALGLTLRVSETNLGRPTYEDLIAELNEPS
jgi:Helix-turn-helix domain